jgi:hypothetical protein
MTDEQLWMEIYKQAGAKMNMFGSGVPPGGVRGRFVATLARTLVTFWLKHQATLIPVLSQLAIAALEAVAQNIAAIEVVNVPGPE